MASMQFNPPVSGADPITQLPADQTQPSHNELRLVDSLFKEHKSTMGVLLNESKDALLIGILFILFSLPQVAELISKFVSLAANSIYINLLIRAVLVMVSYWLIKHFYLSRKD